MCKHVLVIEPRTEIIEDLEDRLESIGHTYDIVSSQRQAREMLDLRTDYSYIILSQEIPVRPGRPSKMKFGYNLFNEIQELFIESIPVIVTVDRRYLNSNTAVKMAHQGAFIAVKPFEDYGEFSLEDVIDKVLELMPVCGSVRANRHEEISVDKNTEDDLPLDDIEECKTEVTPEMVFYNNRVELCGVAVCGDNSTLARRLLDLLKERASDSKYRAYSGYELAAITGCESGQQGVSASISNFRNKALGLLKGKADNLGEIIVNDRSHGYRLEDHIEVIEKTPAKSKKDSGNNIPDDLTDSQKKVMDYLLVNKKAGRSDLENQLNLSRPAINRQLQSLRDLGLVRCAGKGKSTLWLPVDQ